MRAKSVTAVRNESDRIMALDWTSLGREVRRRTLEAVEQHFSGLADSSSQGWMPADMPYEVDWSEA
ncbi:MAG: hypothetical protein JSU63_14205 [Phycisphaerales bacterium]|nr:MAG: hypothetical protein JSU63_14205 [Phycisphaerales bacterium]